MNLIIDAGNTRIKLAVYDGDKMVFQDSWVSLEYEVFSTILKQWKINSSIISETKELDNKIILELGKKTRFLRLDYNTKIPFQNLYKSPETLGKDRIAAAAMAWKMFPGLNSVVVDMGTCITTDVLNANGEFLGGNISPGINMRLKAMHSFTAKLPLVNLLLPDYFIGITTETALQNGALRGTIYEIKGFLKATKYKYGKINVILTGGDASLFAKFSKNKIFVSSNLVLDGLNEILNYNAQ